MLFWVECILLGCWAQVYECGMYVPRVIGSVCELLGCKDQGSSSMYEGKIALLILRETYTFPSLLLFLLSLLPILSRPASMSPFFSLSFHIFLSFILLTLFFHSNDPYYSIFFLPIKFPFICIFIQCPELPSMLLNFSFHLF